MLTIFSFSLSRLNNAEFSGFCANLKKLINKLDPETLGLSESMVTGFNQKHLELVDRVYATTGSPTTAMMQEADERRGLLYKRIRLKLMTVEVAEKGSSLLAIKDVVVTHLLSKYGANVPSMAYQQETAVVEGFIFDLRNKLTDEQAEELGITNDIVALENANNAFADAYSQRVGERVADETAKTLRIRQELNEMIQLMFLHAQFYANSTEAAHKAHVEPCQQFVLYASELMSDAKKRLDARSKGGSVDEGDGTGGSGAGDGAGNGIAGDTNGEGQGGNGNGTGGSIGGIPIVPGDGFLD